MALPLPLRIAAVAFAAMVLAHHPVHAAPPASDATTRETNAAPDAEKLYRAIFKVKTRAVPDARSEKTLGSEREGTGVLIAPDGLIVTIGYLIVEADDVQVIDHRGRLLPAQLVAYDHASGFGLLRSLVPVDGPPIELGASSAIGTSDPVMIATSEGPGDAAFALVVSKRAFTGSWEYMLDDALWTSPPVANWSGAGLIDRHGRLVGIGSLIVRDATGDEPRLPGNLFVPIDTLRAILPDLVAEGHRKGPPRPWLGVAADEVQGRLVVSRVSPGSPADDAGIVAGDIVLGVGDEPVRTQADFYRKLWTGRSAGATIPLRVLQGADVRKLSVRSIDRVDYFKPRTMY